MTSGASPSPTHAARGDKEAEQQAKSASLTSKAGKLRSPQGKGPVLAPGAYNGMPGVEPPTGTAAGSAPRVLPYNASLGGLKGRKVPKNSSFMRNAAKPKAPQQATSKPTLSKPLYYLAVVEASELVGIVPHDRPDLKGLSPTVLKENILPKSKVGSPATSPTAAPKTGVTVGLQQRSLSHYPTVAGAENRS